MPDEFEGQTPMQKEWFVVLKNNEVNKWHRSVQKSTSPDQAWTDAINKAVGAVPYTNFADWILQTINRV